jgi:carbon storage regulator CsrA
VKTERLLKFSPFVTDRVQLPLHLPQKALMLDVSRRRDENVTTGADVCMVVLRIRAGVMSLGIDASPQIAMPRDEVYAKVHEQNRPAAEAGAIPADAVHLLNKPRVPTTGGARTLS